MSREVLPTNGQTCSARNLFAACGLLQVVAVAFRDYAVIFRYNDISVDIIYPKAISGAEEAHFLA